MKLNSITFVFLASCGSNLAITRNEGQPVSSQQSDPFAATHSTLNNVDVLLIIFDWLYPNLFAPGVSKEGATISQRTLARLARTCQSFKDPALAMLWKDQDGLDAILRLVRLADSRIVRTSRTKYGSMLTYLYDFIRKAKPGTRLTFSHIPD